MTDSRRRSFLKSLCRTRFRLRRSPVVPCPRRGCDPLAARLGLGGASPSDARCARASRASRSARSGTAVPSEGRRRASSSGSLSFEPVAEEQSRLIFGPTRFSTDPPTPRPQWSSPSSKRSTSRPTKRHGSRFSRALARGATAKPCLKNQLPDRVPTPSSAMPGATTSRRARPARLFLLEPREATDLGHTEPRSNGKRAAASTPRPTSPLRSGRDGRLMRWRRTIEDRRCRHRCRHQRGGHGGRTS